MLPPKEWKLLGAAGHVEIYEVPAGWTYTVPDGRDLARGSVLHALAHDDFMLFFANLDPGFLSSLTEERFWALFNGLKSEVAAGRADAVAGRMEFRESDGKWKVAFP